MSVARLFSGSHLTHVERLQMDLLEPRRLLALTPVAAVPISGFGEQTVADVSIDATGNTYAVGSLLGTTDFNPARNRGLELNTADGVGFVVKYSPAGAPIWAKSIPGRPAKVAVDGAGNVLIAGQFGGAQDFNSGAGQALLESGEDEQDGFVLKLDAAGAFQNANKFTADHDTIVTGLAVDSAGYVFVSATSESGALSAQPLHGEEDEHHDKGILAKFNARLKNVFLSTLEGEEADVDTAGLAVVGGAVYLVGHADAGGDLDPSALGIRAVRRSTSYLARYDADGAYQWHIGYLADEATLRGVAATEGGSAFVVGNFDDTVDFNPHSRRTFEISAAGLQDGFVAEFGWAGGLARVATIGGGTIQTTAIAASRSGDRVVVGGYFTGVATFGGTSLQSAGSGDGFIARLGRGNSFSDVMRYGNTTGESAPVLAISRGGGRLVMGGSIAGPGAVDFDPGAGVLEITPRESDGGEGFVVWY